MNDCKLRGPQGICDDEHALTFGEHCPPRSEKTCPDNPNRLPSSRDEKTENTVYAGAKPIGKEITVTVFIDSKKAEEKLEQIERRARRINRLLRQMHKELAALGIKGEEAEQ